MPQISINRRTNDSSYSETLTDSLACSKYFSLAAVFPLFQSSPLLHEFRTELFIRNWLNETEMNLEYFCRNSRSVIMLSNNMLLCQMALEKSDTKTSIYDPAQPYCFKFAKILSSFALI